MIDQSSLPTQSALIRAYVIANMKGLHVNQYRTTGCVTKDISPGKHAVLIDGNKCSRSYVLYVSSQDGTVEIERTA